MTYVVGIVAAFAVFITNNFMARERNSRFVKFYIVAAYVLLLALGGGAVWFVYDQAYGSNTSAVDDWQLKNRSTLVNKLLYSLYKAENNGMMLVFGNSSKYGEYKENMNDVYVVLDTLKTYASDTVQVARIDSINDLILMKELSLGALLEDYDFKKYHESINQRIEGFMPDSSDISRHIVAETKMSVRRDTLVTKRNTGNFFKRFRNVFKKEQKDSTVITTANVRIDSVHVSLADSINVLLTDLKNNVIGAQNELVNRQRTRWQRVALENYRINNLIYRLIRDFDADESSAMLQKITEQETRREDTVKLLAAVAIFSIVVVVLFLFIIWRELSRSNRYRRELEQLNWEKEQLLQSREQLMLAITHDFKAPLSSIIGYSELLDRIVVDKRQKLYLGNIKSASDLLLSLVTDLLDFYRLDSDKADLKVVPFNVKELFESVYHTFLPIALGKNIALTFECKVEEDVTVENDPLKVTQIVNNLLSNAIKFTDKGSVGITVCVEDGFLKFSVSDTGRGISPLEKARLFEMFVRLSSSTGVQGFGLGLSIVDRIVKLLGGTIDVESQLGVGSCFNVAIPVEIVEPEESDGKENVDDTQPEEKSVGGCHLLLVDDDSLQMGIVVEMCKNIGATADMCQYPKYAQRMVADSHYDMVMTDIQMPEMSGFDVLKSVKAVHSDLPVVAVTARTVDKKDYLSAGFSDVLTKPFKETELIRVLQEHIKDKNVQLTETGQSDEMVGLSALTAFAEDDEGAKKEILESFISQTQENLENLKSAIAEGNKEQVRALCHKMMPIFTMIGEKEVTAILRKYEVESKDYQMMSPEEAETLITHILKVIETAKQY